MIAASSTATIPFISCATMASLTMRLHSTTRSLGIMWGCSGK
jgi:hypothetical protein